MVFYYEDRHTIGFNDDDVKIKVVLLEIVFVEMMMEVVVLKFSLF